MKASRLWPQIHKWVGLIIGIQVLLWILGGVVMTVFPLNVVRSEHNIRERAPAVLPAAEYLSPTELLGAVDGGVTGVTLRSLEGRPVYQLRGADGATRLYDAVSGALISPLDGATAVQIAAADFAGEARPDRAEWLTEHNVEYRGALPIWRVAMNDKGGTYLYVSPDSGAVVARRSDIWRLYDFFWMLHIMDYENRTDFNNPLVIWASIIALVLTASGIVLFFYRLSRRDFRWIAGPNREAKNEKV